jgi:transposase-like protein
MTKREPRDAIYRRRRFSGETIELCVRWYLTYRLSYRDLAAMMAERGIAVSHTTILRWVLRFVPEYERRWGRYARPPGVSWRMDETAVNVRGGRHYLYRAVDKVGKSVAVEQDHRAIKQRCAPMLGLKSFCSAAITLAGIELAHRVRKKQLLLPIGGGETRSSLKSLWDHALHQDYKPAANDQAARPSMHQISGSARRHATNAEKPATGWVRYPRKLSFGKSLYLLITPKGTRCWRYCYRYGGKRRTLALGIFPDVPVARARSRHLAARQLLAAGVDPSLKRKELRCER